MIDLRGALQQLFEKGEAAVLVTVAGTRGSTPRETGAAMIVTATETIGTIGGGQLEYQSTKEACKFLANSGATESGRRRHSRKYTLGANCGQCCGGVAEILFEELSASDSGRLEQLLPLSDDYFNVVIFGAGHVGRACTAVLSMLDTHIKLVDNRAGFLDDQLPSNVTAHAVADPASVVADTPTNSYYLVMTHDHGLDFDICSRILQRRDVAFCGLIGSRSKRRRFEKRFRELGLTEAEIAGLSCPIGVDLVGGKKPAEIAVAVAAQLQNLHEIEIHSGETKSARRLSVVPTKQAIGSGM